MNRPHDFPVLDHRDWVLPRFADDSRRVSNNWLFSHTQAYTTLVREYLKGRMITANHIPMVYVEFLENEELVGLCFAFVQVKVDTLKDIVKKLNNKEVTAEVQSQCHKELVQLASQLRFKG